MFYNPEQPLRKHLNHLPHWQQQSSLIFITWRLADSVPAHLVQQWRTDRETWLTCHPKPWDDATETQYHQLFSSQLEDWMDQGMGSCILRRPEIARLLANSLMFFDNERYKIDSFVIMPNHVHVLMQLAHGHLLEKTIQTWKRHSARQINILEQQSGSIWQKRYWDRLVRNEDHFWKIRHYIQRNPETAKLKESEYLLYTPWHT